MGRGEGALDKATGVYAPVNYVRPGSLMCGMTLLITALVHHHPDAASCASQFRPRTDRPSHLCSIALAASCACLGQHPPAPSRAARDGGLDHAVVDRHTGLWPMHVLPIDGAGLVPPDCQVVASSTCGYHARACMRVPPGYGYVAYGYVTFGYGCVT